MRSEQFPDGSWEIPAPWQSGLSNGTQCGLTISHIINGWVSERFGYRYTIITCLGLIRTWSMRSVSISLTDSLLNFCWGLRQVIGVCTVKGCLGIEGNMAYPIPYALQWMRPLTPKIGRVEDANKALLRLTPLNREQDFDADKTVAMIAHMTSLEEKITAGATDWDLFKGTDLLRTEIVGNSFAVYATYFLVQAGQDPVIPSWFLMSLGIAGDALIFMVLWGCDRCSSLSASLGIPPNRDAASLSTGFLMLISTRRFQIKTVALGRVCYAILAIITNVLTSYIPNPSERNLSNYVYQTRGWVFAEPGLLFERNLSARKFTMTSVDVSGEGIDGGVIRGVGRELGNDSV
ncbi:hypothetical protein K469DRAFT_732352 [Zopfia rhizophila CBS 207.26]|uniref:MFS general substrate transporter n=1 Tax=Zopfia rhizophila CBS 207.26 TaxID=1314779 RepID=A0A6A6DEM3_9PEZI|nr:hypothetical protein K469DRAFT_732352 [Zopfia rhizophila CBS 207.26]